MNLRFDPIYLIYALLIIGLFLICKHSFDTLLSFGRSRARFRMLQNELGKESRVQTHLALLLRNTIGLTQKKYVNYFIAGSILLGLVLFVLVRQILTAKMALLAFILGVIMPYAVLRIILEQKRHKGSHEGDILIAELINQYKINYYKMDEAIEKTAALIDNAPISQKLLIRLSSGLKSYQSDEELRAILDEFEYNYKTNWAHVLRNNMYYALADGIVVTDALRDLMGSIAKARKIIEHTKRENSETENMLKYLAPGCYLLTVVCAVKYFGFTLGKFIEYQFYTPSGLKFFLVFLTAYIISVSLAIFYQKRKMDL